MLYLMFLFSVFCLVFASLSLQRLIKSGKKLSDWDVGEVISSVVIFVLFWKSPEMFFVTGFVILKTWFGG